MVSPCPEFAHGPPGSANSPEGKESHNSQGHQQLDQQDGIDLGEGMIMWGVPRDPSSQGLI